MRLPVGGRSTWTPSTVGLNVAVARQTIIPFDVDFQPSARAKPGDFAVVPGLRQGGKKLQFAGFALHQHLGDSGGSSEVAIDLKRRVIVEQVRQRGPAPAAQSDFR